MLNPNPSGPAHCVAVIGGATAGAEVAARLADRGAQVAVFEQNPRPYGKIEDGLPRWHVNLRNKEYATIGAKLSRGGVHFVPNTRIGRDIDFADLTKEWGFTAVILANGAWRDRALPIDGAERFVDKGLIYQNPFVIAFNHSGEAAFEGQRFDVQDDTMVVGGGLASIDVAKIIMLETTRAKMAERGIEVSVNDLEIKGIPKILAAHGLEFDELGIAGCTIFYRRDVEDMPLSEIPEGATPERAAKVRSGRRRILEKATRKFLFRLEPLCAPDGLLTEGDRLVGLRFKRTKIENGRVVVQDETFEARGSCVISSIGSIPEPISGIAMKGELFDFADWDIGRIDAYPTVFSVGNVVTGKGNIVASRKHATHVSEVAIEKFLGLGDDRDGEESLHDAASASPEAEAERIASELEQRAPASAEDVAAVLDRVRARQAAVGYGGDYAEWIAHVTPSDSE